MTLSRDERAAKAAKTKQERIERRQGVDEKRPWLFPVIVGVALIVLIGAIVAVSWIGVKF